MATRMGSRRILQTSLPSLVSVALLLLLLGAAVLAAPLPRDGYIGDATTVLLSDRRSGAASDGEIDETFRGRGKLSPSKKAGRGGATGRKYELRRKLLAEALDPDIALYPSHLGTLPPLAPVEGGPKHNRHSSRAIFVANTAMFQQEIPFFRTLRRYYDGDIVMAVSPNAPDYYIDWATRTYNSVVYVVPTQKSGSKNVALLGRPNSTMPAAQFRYYLYRLWAQQYNRDTIIMLSDFRDVLFQSNPFDYMLGSWLRTPFSMAVVLENHPLKIIESCNFNGVWMSKCYGPPQTKHVAWHTVSCSGISYGMRNAIAIYSYLISSHLDPSVRRKSAQDFLSKRVGLGGDAAVPKESMHQEFSSNERCMSPGMDQGIHNWLLYSGELERSLGEPPFMFKQGDGPVNTLGSFVGHAVRMKHDMFDIGVLKRVEKDKTAFNQTLLQGGKFNKHLSSILHQLDPVVVMNYNGDPSPVVHQFDRIEGGAYAIPNIIMAAKLD